MRSRRSRTVTAARLAILLVSVTFLPSALLVWLGLTLLGQDRDLVAQRDFEQRQAAGPAVVNALRERLTALAKGIDREPPPAGGAKLIVRDEAVEIHPEARAAWLPVAPRLPEADHRVFGSAEALELRDPSSARGLYAALARSADPAVRAGALLRMATIDRMSERWDDALGNYERMARLTAVAVVGAPADLQARRYSLDVLADAGRTDRLSRDAAALEHDLLSGRWPLDRVAWQIAEATLRERTGRSLPVSADRVTTSVLAEELWHERRRGTTAPSVRLFPHANTYLTVLAARSFDRTVAAAFPMTVVESWIYEALKNTVSPGARVSIQSPAGDRIAGDEPTAGTPNVTLPAAEFGLPWTLVVLPGDMSDLTAAYNSRRRMLLAGFAALVVLVGGGTYVVWRAVYREIAVARVQTDFVAAVSHEFRTPLAAMRHATELLDEHDADPAERREFYRSIGRNLERLGRLVESVLDFARMESGRAPYALRDVNPANLVEELVAHFRNDAASRQIALSLTVSPEARVTVRADAVSLGTALWNLLDNAVKYSPERPDIGVTLERRGNTIAIAVTDRGMGIPAAEQLDVFDRFKRGSGATSRGIKGTGLGLALVQHIVRAHSGTIELHSAPGAGSTFTIVLPVVDEVPVLTPSLSWPRS